MSKQVCAYIHSYHRTPTRAPNSQTYQFQACSFEHSIISLNSVGRVRNSRKTVGFPVYGLSVVSSWATSGA